MANENRIRVQLPALPAPAFFGDPNFSILTADGQFLLSYDPQTLAGFVYEIETARWLISAPVDFIQFAAFCAYAGHTLPEGDAAERWISACSNPPGGRLN